MFGKLKEIISNARINISSSLQLVNLEEIGLSVILSVIALIILINISRVIQSAQKNYSVYLHEKSLLEDIRGANKDLNEEYAYVSSEEAKKLLARDVLGLASPYETLYRTKDNALFIEVETPLLDTSKKQNYRSWWEMLLR